MREGYGAYIIGAADRFGRLFNGAAGSRIGVAVGTNSVRVVGGDVHYRVGRNNRSTILGIQENIKLIVITTKTI